MWTITSDWSKNSKNNYQAEFQANISDLNCREGQKLVFPNVMHSFQKVSIDGSLIYSYGDEGQNYIRSIYGSPVLPCESIRGEKISWIVISPFKFFAKVNSYPYISKYSEVINRIEIKHLAIYGALFVFALVLFFGIKTQSLYMQSVYLGLFSVSMSAFFLSSVLGLVGIKLDLLLVDKIAAFSLGVATFSFVSFLKVRGLLAKKIFYVFCFLTIPGTLVIPFLSSGDTIQVFLNIIFAPGVLSTWIAFYSEFRFNIHSSWKAKALDLAALSSFAGATTLDVCYTMGLHNYGMVLGYGVLGTVFFFTRSLQTEINQTYQERDYLRENLELEVNRKTIELKNKTVDLEKTMLELKTTQAELVQTAKLASLGTLAAGIAHEINNSVNYVNGALVPLERIIEKNITDESSKNKTEKLMKVMKEGLGLTIDIIKSLRNYTGLNQAQFNDLNIDEIINSVLTIQKNKISNKIKVNLDIPNNLKVYGSVVGLNQVLMNLISNSIDAMPDGGTLDIKAQEVDKFVVVEVSDTGHGIPENIQSKIFDPFFTTKPVGKGTGLGLHIVLNEIKKHSGAIDVSSVINEGTKFTIRLPISDIAGAKDKVA
ncbi:MAG: ATP-binding protein [Bdellovibrionota bacterium]